MFKIYDDYVQMDGTFGVDFKSKKITATRFSGILGHDKYSTRFRIWCSMMGLFKEDTRGNKFINAGKILEPKIVKYLRTKPEYRGLYQVKDVLGKDCFDIFKEDAVFGGQPDGVLIPSGSAIEFESAEEVVEIKTASNMANWGFGPPENYIIQTALYTYLLKKDKFRIICLDVSDVDIGSTEELVQLVIRDNKVSTFKFSLSKDLPNFKEMYETGLRFWMDHIVTGTSPKFDKAVDYPPLRQLNDWLDAHSGKELDQRMARLDLLVYQKLHMMAALCGIEKELTSLRKELKPLFASKQIPSVYGSVGLDIKVSNRTSADTKALIANGLEKYVVTKPTATFSTEYTASVTNREPIDVFIMKPYGEVEMRKLNKINGTLIIALRDNFPDFVFDREDVGRLRVYFPKFVLNGAEALPVVELGETLTAVGMCIWTALDSAGSECGITEEQICEVMTMFGSSSDAEVESPEDSGRGSTADEVASANEVSGSRSDEEMTSLFAGMV